MGIYKRGLGRYSTQNPEIQMKFTFHGHRPALFQTQAARSHSASSGPLSQATDLAVTPGDGQPSHRPVKQIYMGFFKVKVHRLAPPASLRREPLYTSTMSSTSENRSTDPSSSNPQSRVAEQNLTTTENKPEVQQQPTPSLLEEFQKIFSEFAGGRIEHFDKKTSADEKLNTWKWRTSTLADICLRNAQALNLTPQDLHDLKMVCTQPTPEFISFSHSLKEKKTFGLQRKDSVDSNLSTHTSSSHEENHTLVSSLSKDSLQDRPNTRIGTPVGRFSNHPPETFEQEQIEI